jgi:AhpD family alkylhydroperoxidase
MNSVGRDEGARMNDVRPELTMIDDRLERNTNVQARMTQPALMIPEALRALQALGAATHGRGLPLVTAGLVHLRASQINGCGVCVEMHARGLKDAGQSDERVFAVAAWRDSPYFTDAERAALALTEAVTRIADQPEPVPDDVWGDAARWYDEPALAALLIEIATINAFNRLNVATRQPAGEHTKRFAVSYAEEVVGAAAR